MVRVIGRVDLADEVHRALTAAGIDSYVVTAGPTSAVESTGKDGSDADVVVHDPGMCGAIKRKARHRPVVMVTAAKHEQLVLARMGGALGPDAHVVWPASGDELRSGIARAVAAATTGRPRFPGGTLPGGILFVLGAVLQTISVVSEIAGADATHRLVSPFGPGLIGFGQLLGWPYSLPRRWNLITGVMLIICSIVLFIL